MAASTVSNTSRDVPSRSLPLEHGQSLRADEFHQRYHAMPEVKKAELIEEIVHMPSPVDFVDHAEPHGDLFYWLKTYSIRTPGVRTGIEGTVRLGDSDEPQPDSVLFIDPRYGGQTRIGRYLSGAPELVAEISSSTLSVDRNAKLRVYQRYGVREYIIWKIAHRAIDWLVLRDGVFQPLLPSPDGLIRGETFPGLWLDPEAMAHGRREAWLEALQRGLASPEHADFVDRLRQQSSNP